MDIIIINNNVIIINIIFNIIVSINSNIIIIMIKKNFFKCSMYSWNRDSSPSYNKILNNDRINKIIIEHNTILCIYIRSQIVTI